MSEFILIVGRCDVFLGPMTKPLSLFIHCFINLYNTWCSGIFRNSD